MSLEQEFISPVFMSLPCGVAWLVVGGASAELNWLSFVYKPTSQPLIPGMTCKSPTKV